MITELIKLERPLVGLDLETTGTSTKIDRIVQIGVVKVEVDGQLKEWSTLIKPGVPIQPGAIEAHHITEEMVANAEPFSKYARGLAAGFSGCDFFGFNVTFDLEILAEEFGRVGIQFSHGLIVDSMRIYHKQQPRNLTAAVKHYLGEDLVDAHDALADIKATFRVLVEQLKQHEDLPRSVQGLNDMFFKVDPDSLDRKGRLVWRNGEVIVNFGKHAGKPFKALPRPYLEWMASPAFTGGDDIKIVVRNALAGIFPQQEK